MPTAILVVSVLIAGLLVYLVIRVTRDSPDRAELARLRGRDEDYRESQAQLEKSTSLAETLREEKIRLEADLRNERRNTEERMRFLEESEERLRKEFENLANRIFEEKGKAFTEKNSEGITGLLLPFREQLESFRSKVEKEEKERIAGNAALIQEIRQLHDLSNRVSEDANNLARAIKGDVKKQGDWGEVIVERIFEASGLQAGLEYEKQAVIRDEDDRLNRPDFVIHLPGRKDVIVDSKVSLTAFERYLSCEDEKTSDKLLKEHVQSVKNHVKELSEKDYSCLLGSRSLDFVIMCIPLEPAYQAALRADPGIVYELSGKNVVISGPTTLMITLKLIAQVWRRENENRNAGKIAERAGRLYDQVARVVDAMKESQKRLSGVSDSFENALGLLQHNRGNLVGQVEKIRALGAKVSKQIPEGVVEDATAEDEAGE